MSALLTVGIRQHRQGREVYQRVPRNGHRGAASRRELPPSLRSPPAARRFASAWARSRTSARTPWNRSSPRAPKAARFTSLYDFCERVDLSAVNRRMIESFIKAGALDSLGARTGAVVRRDRRRHGNRHAGAEGSRQRPIRPVRRSRRPANPRRRSPLPTVPDWTPKEKLDRRKRDARVLHHRPSTRPVHG